jgi:formylglycine-generating enzyme required for sulfatase activity
MTPEHFAPRLAQLGFQSRVIRGVEIIIPPVCTVPAGPFLMGSDLELDHDATANEQPQHRVELAAFQIAKYPVTVAEYACFVRAGHAPPPPPDEIDSMDVPAWDQELVSGLDYPMVRVSWHDAMQYAAWLAEVSGQPWHVPTEAEWEKAARWDPDTGTSLVYPWGNAWGDHSTGSLYGISQGLYPIGAVALGTSPCGVEEIAGNVVDWTSSLYQPYPYVATDGREDPSAEGERVTRGAGWVSEAEMARGAYREPVRPEVLSDYIGFRLVRAS